MIGAEIKSVVAGILLAFGVSAPIPDFAAGMVIAIGGCYALLIVSEPASRLSVWGTVFLGVIGAVFAAVLHQHISLLKSWPLQAVMGGAGAMSKFIAESAISFGQALKEWAASLPAKWKLPGKGDR